MPKKKKSLLQKIFKSKPKVAVLKLSGIIGEGGSFKKGLNIDSVNDDIEKAFDVKKAKAVALVINSPGGSPVQSELISKRIRELSAEKKIPVYSFAEDVAASGGYWLLCAGDEMYATHSSLVGSIGVISAGFGFVDAIKKLGIERRVYHQGDNKSILDPFQKQKPADVEILMNAQKDVHEAFKEMVKDRRGSKIKKRDEPKLFSGEFWTGKTAADLGLIDAIGDVRSVMKEKFGNDIEFVKISKPKGWLQKKMSACSEDIASSVVKVAHENIMWSKFGR